MEDGTQIYVSNAAQYYIENRSDAIYTIVMLTCMIDDRAVNSSMYCYKVPNNNHREKKIIFCAKLFLFLREKKFFSTYSNLNPLNSVLA